MSTGDRPVVDGAEASGPVPPGGAAAGPPGETPVSGAASSREATVADDDAARMAGEDAPKAPNQSKTEPIPPTPTHDGPVATAGPPGEVAGGWPDGATDGGSADGATDGGSAHGSAAGGSAAAGEAGARPDDDAGTVQSPGPRAGWAAPPPTSRSADAQGVPVPGELPAEGTSERSAPIEGVAFPAVAPEGLADGETDVTMPSTTHF